jgi:hypothetical protein
MYMHPPAEGCAMRSLAQLFGLEVEFYQMVGTESYGTGDATSLRTSHAIQSQASGEPQLRGAWRPSDSWALPDHTRDKWPEKATVAQR